MTLSRGPRLLALTAGAVLFGLAVTEAAGHGMFWLKHRRWPIQAAQAFYTPEHHYMTDHPYLPYLALPGRHGGMDFNSFGDRGPEPDRPKKRVRLICFGGSTTFDMAHPLELTWPGILQTRLGPRYEVINAAQNGATTADTLVNFALLHGDLQPDFVLAYEGANDLESSFLAGFRPDYAHRRRKIGENPYPFFRVLPRWLDYSSLYVAVRLALTGPRGDLHALFSRPGWYDFKNGPFGLPTFERNLLNLDALARRVGAKVVLGSVQYHPAWALAHSGRDFAEGWRRGIDSQNDIVRALARKEPNIWLAEVARSFEPTDGEMADSIHLTESGNRLVAAAFYAAVKRAEERKHP